MKYLFCFENFTESNVNDFDDYLYVDKSTIPNSGMGLFTKKDFEVDDIICKFTGELVDTKETIRRNKRSSKRGDYFIDMGNEITLDAYDSDCLAKYANDADGPNKIDGISNNSEIIVFEDEPSEAYIVATRDIKSGEEILCSYGESYWKNI